MSQQRLSILPYDLDFSKEFNFQGANTKQKISFYSTFRWNYKRKIRNNFYLNRKKYVEFYRSYTTIIYYINICISLQKKLYSSVYSKI